MESNNYTVCPLPTATSVFNTSWLQGDCWLFSVFLPPPPPSLFFYVCVKARREKCLSYVISFPPPSLRVSSPTGAGVLHRLSLGSIFFALQRIGHLEQIQLKLACELIIGVSYQDKWNASKLDFIHFTASHNSSARVYHPRSCLTLSSFYDDWVFRLWATPTEEGWDFQMCHIFVLFSHGSWKPETFSLILEIPNKSAGQSGSCSIVDREIRLTFIVTMLHCGEWLVTLICPKVC